ncbi:MAG TPA: hypothetical protein IAB07_02015 [Candidatus Caccalectryoclostridium excrementigallinarum]|uniref:YccF family protein n=1 Tax=Candidatus Caccalectryoclostridium excrementigallinarum TaxID=2840710 RepID=A0A9D1MLK7_9FIRM|nr:hypothetical protein [Candidatus Caccalectryoclostridium excrementigallinarum]
MRYLKKAAYYLGNACWKTLGGGLSALVWLALSALFAASLVGFPLSLTTLKNAYVCLKPFGSRITLVLGKNALLGLVWTLTAGWAFALFEIIRACAFLALPAGAFFAPQWLKLIRLALFPFSCESN